MVGEHTATTSVDFLRPLVSPARAYTLYISEAVNFRHIYAPLLSPTAPNVNNKPEIYSPTTIRSKRLYLCHGSARLWQPGHRSILLRRTRRVLRAGCVG